MYEEQGEGFDEGEDVDERPLRGAELGVDQRISRQVSISRWFGRNNRCVVFFVPGNVHAIEYRLPISAQRFRFLCSFEFRARAEF